jgi:hypothetical protein
MFSEMGLNRPDCVFASTRPPWTFKTRPTNSNEARRSPQDRRNLIGYANASAGLLTSLSCGTIRPTLADTLKGTI